MNTTIMATVEKSTGEIKYLSITGDVMGKAKIVGAKLLNYNDLMGFVQSLKPFNTTLRESNIEVKP